MAKNKNKKAGFLKRQREKLERTRRQHKKALKNVIKPIQHLKHLSPEEIKHSLEESPNILQEKEFENFAFNPDLIVKSTNMVLERYQQIFAKAAEKSLLRKREIFEDFSVETVGKLVNKAFMASVVRRLRICAKRLRDEGKTDLMKKAIVAEATLSIPQSPAEAHPFVVAMYEAGRATALKDFTVPGFEQVLSWQDRLAFEREEEKTVRGSLLNEAEVISILEADSQFTKVDAEQGVAFRWLGAAAEGADALPRDEADAGLLTIIAADLVLKTPSYALAEEARELLSDILGNNFLTPRSEDDVEEESEENKLPSYTLPDDMREELQDSAPEREIPVKEKAGRKKKGEK